jgi:hypothetical protein
LFTLIITFITNFLIIENKSHFQFDHTSFNIEDIDKLSTSFYEAREINEKCFLIGLLQEHKSIKCDNINCYSHRGEVFCNEIESDISIDSINRFDTIIRHFLKCLFENLIKRESLNYEALLRYC